MAHLYKYPLNLGIFGNVRDFLVFLPSFNCGFPVKLPGGFMQQRQEGN